MHMWKRDESWELIDVLLVTSMETIPRHGAARSQRKRR